MHKISFYVPVEHAEKVKQAMFAAGAGKIGNYDSCCWQVLGQGQFRPCDNSQPFIGQTGEISFVEEYMIEMVCEDDVVLDVVNALKAHHPYEEPAFQIWKVLSF